MNKPSTMITTPPIRPIISLEVENRRPNAVAAPPHPIMKTSEKPMTNKKAWNMT
jgi:hypothetical protein